MRNTVDGQAETQAWGGIGIEDGLLGRGVDACCRSRGEVVVGEEGPVVGGGRSGVGSRLRVVGRLLVDGVGVGGRSCMFGPVGR